MTGWKMKPRDSIKNTLQRMLHYETLYQNIDLGEQKAAEQTDRVSRVHLRVFQQS